MTVILDFPIEDRHNLVAGANREGYRLRNVTRGRDFIPTLTADVRNMIEGEMLSAMSGFTRQSTESRESH